VSELDALPLSQQELRDVRQWATERAPKGPLPVGRLQAATLAVRLLGNIAELTAELDRVHTHREYGYFGYMGKADWAQRRVGRAGCHVCEMIGRPIHEHPAPEARRYGWARVDRCLAWADPEDA